MEYKINGSRKRPLGQRKGKGGRVLLSSMGIYLVREDDRVGGTEHTPKMRKGGSTGAISPR